MRKQIVSIGALLALAVCGSASAAPRPHPRQAIVVGSRHGTLLLASPSRRLSALARRAVVQGQGELDEQNEEAVGNARELEVQGTVSAVAPGSVTLTIDGQTLAVPLPPGLVLPASAVGTQIELEFANEFANENGNENEHSVSAVPTTRPATTAPATTTATVTSRGRDGDRHDGGGDDGDGHHGGGGGDD